MLTDGTAVYVTDLSDPTSINPLKYGSAEADPDPVEGVLKYRNEAVAVGRYTIEFLQDIGGSLFPFQRIDGAEIMRGAVGEKAFCLFAEQIAFLGSGRNEACAVYLGVNGVSNKISTPEIDKIIAQFPETALLRSIVEGRLDSGRWLLYVSLPDRTLVYDHRATQAAQEPIWFTLDSGLGVPSRYRANFFVWAYDQWNFGDPTSSQYGRLDETTSHHFGQQVTWEFGTIYIYNASNGVVIHELELIALTGQVENALNPTVWTSYSTDGATWSIERPRSVGKIGNRASRVNWLQCGNMRNYRIQKFRGTSAAHITVLALEARIEALND
jgi:hypothetical protein